ncbi:hypothetical protein V5O48_007949 [Marasmius crinis-equi]|uniref:Uncharacterized protein n=1 Tax=Marasmius crinis-equi TaxID=585013 RepID=A0ABR3FF85_9AGAR
MAGLLDVVSFITTAAFFGGVIYGVLYLVRSVNSGIENTKAQLKERGYDVSSGGVKVKTSKRFDREDYVDATQRGFVKAMEASSFRKGGSNTSSPVVNHIQRTPSLGVESSPKLQRAPSSNSVSSDKSSSVKGFFGKKKKE